ncbi:glycoside hydrolase family 47 protein [Hypoxylon sp. NC1633]|nr:glycoside hydrolase family 47 protein [Hypoxylon sp. NC1633]
MAKIVRRPSRIATVLASVSVLYLIATLLPPRSLAPKLHESYTYVESSFDWSSLPQRHPIPESDITSLPKGTPLDLPNIQFAFKADRSAPGRARTQTLANQREEVRDAFLKSWTSYKERAWMYDELAPVSGEGKNTFGGWAATLVDALDALWIMDLKTEFYDAVGAVAVIDWNDTSETACNFFETTIRHLGGLLSAYDLSGEEVVLRKAVELGDMLYAAFDTPNRMPPFWFDFGKAKEGTLRPGTHDPAASVTSSCLEFTRLAQLTGEDKYYDAIDRITRLLDRTQNATKLPGMWPTFFDMENMDLVHDDSFTLGALADSLYELLPKMYALLGGLEPVYGKLYRDAMDTVKKHLLFRPMLPHQDDILFSGNVHVGGDSDVNLQPEGQHLACFVGERGKPQCSLNYTLRSRENPKPLSNLPMAIPATEFHIGMLGVGGKLLGIAEHVQLGEKITRGCVWAYEAMPTGIMPEIFGLIPCPSLEGCRWDEEAWAARGDQSLRKGFQNARDPRYLLRPEAIESVFLMYRITGDPEYQDMAWRMFRAIRAATETELAFSAIADVTASGPTEKLDSMESFWMSETLKYFYLTFSPPDLISLDEYVLNTEAHPLRRP